MLRLNAKHIEVLKPHILVMLATEQHSSNHHYVPGIHSKMGLIDEEEKKSSFVIR